MNLSCVCVQMDLWVTQGGADPLPLEEEHCSVVEVTEEDIQNSVKFVPSLSAVVRDPDSPPFTKHYCVCGPDSTFLSHVIVSSWDNAPVR